MGNLLDDIRHEQMLLAERMVIRSLHRQGLAEPSAKWDEHCQPLLGRCLLTIGTLIGESEDEQVLLDALIADLKLAMGLKKLVPGGLI